MPIYRLDRGLIQLYFGSRKDFEIFAPKIQRFGETDVNRWETLDRSATLGASDAKTANKTNSVALAD